MKARLQIFGEVPEERLERVNSVDIVLVACGYETRSRAFVERFAFGAAAKHALVFPGPHVLGFAKNAAVLAEHHYALHTVDDERMVEVITAIIERFVHTARREELRVFIDISSQSRVRLASVVEAVCTAKTSRPIRVFFGYSLAEFSAPANASSPNIDIGPVTDYFAGWPSEPELPTALVVGLGHESDRAMGAVEHLEPSQVWAMLPHSQVREYDESLLNANRQLLSQIDRSRVITYEVEDPNATLAVFAALVHDLAARGKVLLLPSGPKLLVLMALLLACTRDDVAVWRVSAGTSETPVDRIPSGAQVIFEAMFFPRFEVAQGH